jgi:hypothetical protein
MADYKKYLQFLEDQQIEENKKVVDEFLCAGFIDNFLRSVTAVRRENDAPN